MHSPRVELDEAYATGDMITVCWEPNCRMHRLYYWEDDRWVEHDKRHEYANYTHSICDQHFRMYQRELKRLMDEETAGVEAELYLAEAAG
jgi:hypothetical protein